VTFVILSSMITGLAFDNGEFDPGSEQTLEGCIKHASRTAARVLAPGGEWRTGE